MWSFGPVVLQQEHKEQAGHEEGGSDSSAGETVKVGAWEHVDSSYWHSARMRIWKQLSTGHSNTGHDRGPCRQSQEWKHRVEDALCQCHFQGLLFCIWVLSNLKQDARLPPGYFPPPNCVKIAFLGKNNNFWIKISIFLPILKSWILVGKACLRNFTRFSAFYVKFCSNYVILMYSRFFNSNVFRHFTPFFSVYELLWRFLCRSVEDRRTARFTYRCVQLAISF